MNKLIYLVLTLILSQPINLFNKSEIIKYSEIGYSREFWDTEVIKVRLRCVNGKVEGRIETTENNIMVSNKTKKIQTNNYLELGEYINTEGILLLKNAAWLNGSLSSEEFHSLYKKTPRMYSYIYSFFFICGDKEYRFVVDDIGYIKDPRYINVLKRINKLLNIKTEINVYGDDSILFLAKMKNGKEMSENVQRKRMSLAKIKNEEEMSEKVQKK